MHTIHQIRWYMENVVWIGALLLQAWALVDCLGRKAAAFPAAGKLTKATWLLLTTLAFAIVLIFLSATNLLAYIAIIVSSVYLADVRPAVKEISGPSRW